MTGSQDHTHRSVERFSSDQEALDFVASHITDEAERDGAPLSEIERKMLYFSESAWTLPDIWEVSDKFDQECDQNAYETKISGLIRKAVTRARKQRHEEFEAWTAAIERVSKDDRYLLVMLGRAGLTSVLHPAGKAGRWVRLLAITVAGAIVFAGFVWVLNTFHPVPGAYSPRAGTYGSPLGETITFSLWAFPVFLIVIHGVFRLALGAQKINEIDGRITKWIFGTSKQSR